MQVTALSFWGHPGLEVGGCKSPSSEGFPSEEEPGPVFPHLFGQVEAGCIPSPAADEAHV